MLWKARNAENELKAPKTEADSGNVDSSNVDSSNDELLLIAAAQKDPARFGDIYERYFDRVYAYIARRVGNRDAAQDLTADVFHRALASIGKYESRGVPFAAWLFRIAANAIADKWKHAAKESGLPSEARAAAEGIDAGKSEIDGAEHRARLFQSVRRLPADQRRVIQMRFAEEKSIRDIAEALNKTEGAIKQLQFRALQNLRERMSGAHE
jgi:RNA polymerase sigma-70 factor (ECF subfamily)